MSPVDLHHCVEGPADAPVLFLSGSLGSTLDMWRPQRDALSVDHRVISYDHRGHGRSPVPPGPYTVATLGSDVLALMDKLDINTASFCGLSIGGAVGMWLAHHAPDRLSRLVLCCTSTRFGEPESWHQRAADVLAGGTESLAGAVVARWFTPRFAAQNPALITSMHAMIAATPNAGYAACCAALANWDFADRLAEIRVPTLVIAGADDPATPPEHASQIADGITDARLEIVPSAAHLATYERADVINELIRGHLAGTP
jgi:3-oxoadipate enol-lactonase